MSAFIVMCRVSGGITGTREAPLKRDGAVIYFDTREKAETEARRLESKMDGSPYRTADFRYWAERVQP